VDDGDVEMRQNLAGIELFDLGIVPGLDGSKEDFRKYRAREAKVSPDAGNVINGDDGNENRWDVQDGRFRRFQLLVAHRHLAGGKVADASGDVLNAFDGAGAEITDLHAGA
jgi:hypothetical protein